MLPDSCLETILVKQNQVKLLQFHKERWYHTIQMILPEYIVNTDFLENAIAPFLQEKPTILSCLWNANNPELIKITPRDYIPNSPPYKILVDASIVKSTNKNSWIKSGNRDFYNATIEMAKQFNCNDALIFNENGFISESCIANIILENDEKYYTPPLEDGCVSGVYRQYLINKNDKIQIQSLTIDDLKSANKIYLCNAVRGLFEVEIDIP